MIDQIVNLLTHFIISFIEQTSYFGVFLLMTAESALIPIPSEVTMTFAGYLVSLGKMNFILLSLVGALANLFGSILAYLLGAWGQEAVVRKFIKKYGKYVLMSEHEFNRSEKWFRQYGEKIVFISRVLPVVRTFISLPAGIAKMNFWRFCVLTFIGSLIWSVLLIYIGFTLGKNWQALEVYYRKFEYLIIGAVVVAAVYYLYHKIKKMKK